MRKHVKRLIQFKTRNTRASNHQEVANWLAARLKGGGAKVRLVPYLLDGKRKAFNVEWKIDGTGTRPGCIMLTAHFDTVNGASDDPDAPAPGANDNASGVAALLELARLLRSQTPDRSIRIVLFSGEEEDSLGAAAYAEELQTEDISVRWLANLDMIGTSGVQPLIRIGVDRVEQARRSRKYQEQRQNFASLAVAQRFVRRTIVSSDIQGIHLGTMDPTDGDFLTTIWLRGKRKFIVFDVSSGSDGLIHGADDLVERDANASAAWDDCNWWRITRLMAHFVFEEAGLPINRRGRGRLSRVGRRTLRPGQ